MKEYIPIVIATIVMGLMYASVMTLVYYITDKRIKDKNNNTNNQKSEENDRTIVH